MRAKVVASEGCRDLGGALPPYRGMDAARENEGYFRDASIVRRMPASCATAADVFRSAVRDPQYALSKHRGHRLRGGHR